MLDDAIKITLAVVVTLFVLMIAVVFVRDRYIRKTNRHLRHWLRTRLGLGYRVDELARRLDVAADNLRRASPTYRAFTIAKRRGGTRQIHAPSPELKRLQQRILRRLLSRLRPHPAATGFQPGLSIVHNAQLHVGQRVVIKLDIVDFFPRTASARIDAYFRRVGWNGEAAAILTRLVTHAGGLPQGAPTSPRLSNLVNHAFDARIDRLVRRFRGVYTRYADDITISFSKDHPRHVRGVIQYTRRLAKAHGYRIHTRGKLRILRRHQQQRVCGLVVNEKVQLPRATRRRLRAIEHRLRTTGQATLTPAQLAGWRAYQAMIVQQRTPALPEPRDATAE